MADPISSITDLRIFVFALAIFRERTNFLAPSFIAKRNESIREKGIPSKAKGNESPCMSALIILSCSPQKLVTIGLALPFGASIHPRPSL